jgi:hypothetical protein
MVEKNFSIQFNRLLLGFLTINIRVNWLFNNAYMTLVGFFYDLRVRPYVDTCATHLLRRNRQDDHFLKGTVSRDFLLLVFFMNQFPPSPRVSH